jgi:hypothetical protein
VTGSTAIPPRFHACRLRRGGPVVGDEPPLRWAEPKAVLMTKA